MHLRETARHVLNNFVARVSTFSVSLLSGNGVRVTDHVLLRHPRPIAGALTERVNPVIATRRLPPRRTASNRAANSRSAR